MKVYFFVSLFYLFCCSSWAEMTATKTVDARISEPRNCEPLVGPDTVMHAAQTAAVCSPAIFAYGASLLAPRAFSQAVSATIARAGKYIGTRAAGTALVGTGILLTVGDVTNLLMSQLTPSVCDADDKFKRDMLTMMNMRADHILKVADGLIDEYGKRRMKFPPAYLTDHYIGDLNCVRLANMMRIKNRLQQQVWGEMLSAAPPRDPKARQTYREKITRIRKTMIPGFHYGAGADPKQIEIDQHVRERDARIAEMKHLIEKASCLDMQTLVNLACAFGDFGLYGKVPSSGEMAQWMKKLRPKDRTPVTGSSTISTKAVRASSLDEEILANGKRLEINEKFEADLNMHVLTTPHTTDQTQNLLFHKFENANGEVTDIYIQFLRGDPNVPGAGTALKNNLLRRYPNSRIISELSATNRSRLLKAVEDNVYEVPRLAELQKVVPAMKASGYDFELTAVIKAGVGSIKLKMIPNGGRAGRLIITDTTKANLSTLSLLRN